MNSVLSSSLLLCLLCGPAIADSTTNYVVELATKTTKQTIVVADRSCAEIQVKSPQRESFLRVCAVGDDKNTKYVRLEVERRTRDNQDESRQAAVVVATSGASYDLLDGRMTVKTQ